MEWETEGDGEDLGGQGVDRAFTLLHPAPPSPKKAKGGKPGVHALDPHAHVARDLLLAGFPPCFKGEEVQQRLRRAAASEACVSRLKTSISEAVAATDAAVFTDLLDFVRGSHASSRDLLASQGRWGGAGKRALPAGLVLAGGVNASDHAQTFPALASHLRNQGCYVSLLHPNSLGKTPSAALQQVIKDFAGLDSPGADTQALAAWYQDETGGGVLGSMDCEAPAPAAAPRAARSSQRGGGGGRSAAQEVALQAPLVLVVEGTDMADPGAFRDLILALSEGCWEVPLTLVLGLTTSAAALHAVLSSDVLERCLACSFFNLASAMDRLNRLVCDALLGGDGRWPGLLFSHAVVARAWDACLLHHFSTGVIGQALRLAALSHFQTAAAGRGLAGAAGLLDWVPGQRDGPGVPAGTAEVVTCWARWAVGLHWAALAARALGQTRACPYWRLYRDALDPGWARAAAGQATLRALEAGLAAAGPGAARALARDLRAAALRVPGAKEALVEELARLREFEREEEENEGMTDEQREEQRGVGIEQQEEQVGDAVGELTNQRASRSAHPASSKPDASQAPPPPGPKSRFHSKASRRAAMLGVAAQRAQHAEPGSDGLCVEARGATKKPGMPAWLRETLARLLAAPPDTLEAAAMVTACRPEALDSLTASPREALMQALTRPERVLGLPGPVGLNAQTEDACLAWQLFEADANCQNVADWFQGFADVRECHGPRKKGRKTGSKAADAKADACADGGARMQVAARFSQAVSELQFVGLIRHATRRKGDYVQRCMYMPAIM
uniref:Uncharacterized protein n=1 Tax=Auxenochlorella protothecoides TaxID=3075 RepID=A0A1D1ZPQ3_AUXPR